LVATVLMSLTHVLDLLHAMPRHPTTGPEQFARPARIRLGAIVDGPTASSSAFQPHHCCRVAFARRASTMSACKVLQGASGARRRTRSRQAPTNRACLCAATRCGNCPSCASTRHPPWALTAELCSHVLKGCAATSAKRSKSTPPVSCVRQQWFGCCVSRRSPKRLNVNRGIAVCVCVVHESACAQVSTFMCMDAHACMGYEPRTLGNRKLAKLAKPKGMKGGAGWVEFRAWRI